MKDVLIVVSTNRGIDRLTEECINPVLLERAEMVKQMGTSDVALARNYALTDACRVLRQYKNLETVLMIDDDMTFTKEQAYEIVDTAKLKNKAVAGTFITQSGVLAAKPLTNKSWVCGLAFIAFPAKLLLAIQDKSRIVTIGTKDPITVFTWSGEDEGQWVSEDYRLCRRLGGIELLPIPIGHLKKIPLIIEDDRDTLQSFLDKTLREYK